MFFLEVYLNYIVRMKCTYLTLLLTLFSVTSYAQIQLGADINSEAAGDGSGWSVSLSSDGKVLAIGAPEIEGNGYGSGHVRVFDLSNLVKIIDIQTKDYVSIFPNPTSGELNITITSEFIGSSYQVSYLLGKEVLNGKINNTNTTIDVSALSKGYYLFQIGDGTVPHKFLVK